MKNLYVGADEEIPPNALEPRKKIVQVSFFANYDNAGYRATWRSQTVIILYCNSAPIIWYSKRHNTVESSNFGENFVALQIVMV